MQPGLVQIPKHPKSEIKLRNREEKPSEQLLQQELSTLKQNIQNLLKYCHGLQNHIKISKRSLPSTKEILEQNDYEIHSGTFLDGNSCLLVQQSYLEKQRNFFSLIEKENSELKKTRQLYLESLNKIHQLKSEVSQLTQKLNQFSGVFQSPNFQKTSMTSLEDILEKELSMGLKKDEKCMTNHGDIDIETLLCHQELNMDSPMLKENSSLRSNKEHRMIQSLISKGIEFRDQRTLKSTEFKKLSTIIERYREVSMSSFTPMQMKKYKSVCYR